MAGEKIISVENSYKAQDIANCLLWLADKEENPMQDPITKESIKDGISNLKLQKLLFFAQATHLALFEKPLFKDEFQAWALGPVIPELYKAYQTHLKDSIPPPQNQPCTDVILMNFLDAIWKTFGKYTASELVNITHKAGSPWHQHYKKDKNEIIPKDEIESYYKRFFKLVDNG